ncbi:phosphoglycolate phosphatase [Tropicibacter oceani]|uniref:Phosphoglycolate phosphatase n=1 Tax=Tropicibacter oceani TaxID=3058420 RepID=A0ABY8QEC6_9RHOB|nr:phosphoglycolate phosphatase [Tropicibacter oceani]WGW02984.1 phosphoglycolate phosphatase [Tropicibacter oceani]
MSARIVFDLDGTLIDSAPDIHAASARMLQAEGLEPLDLATIISFIGNGLPHLTGLVMARAGLAPDRQQELSARVLEHYNAVSGTLTRPYPAVPQTLRALRDQGHVLGICTNKPEAPAHDILRLTGLGPFDCVVGGDSLPQRKPDPAPLHAALAALGQGPAVYVGDSEVDAETAHRAGVPFLLFTEGYRKTPVDALPHSASFADFAELPGLIAALLADT